MSDTVRLAFVGIDHPHGAHWRELLRNFPGQIELTSLVPGYEGACASLEEVYAELPRFGTVEELIAWGEFDAAMVCLPNDVGPKAVEQLAAAGKHVLCEKPLAGSAADVSAALDAVERAHVAFQTGYMWRYDRGSERLRAMLREGRFGKLISAEITFVTSDITRRGPSHYLFRADTSGGGFFNWLACHYLDLLLYVTGESIVGVTARTGVFGGEPAEVEDGGTAIFDLSGGGLATFVGGYWLPRWAGETRLSFRGTERWVHWDPGRPGTGGVLEIHGPKPQWHAMEETFTIPEDKTPGYGGPRGVALVSDWLAAMREPGRKCRNTTQSTRATLELIDAVYRSSREGRRIECQIGDQTRHQTD